MRLTRRRLVGAAPFLAARPALGAPVAALTLILIGDLHSGYRWQPRLLRAVRDAAGAASGPVRIVVNGDVFERNNVVARRSGGVVDLALIEAFAGIAPTLVTIGNHDSDLFDPAVFVSRIAARGAMVLSDIVDPRTGRGYGVPGLRFEAAGMRIAVAALGTDALGLYPPDMRGCYRVPEPAAYAADRLPALLHGAELKLVLVHAGFLADRQVLAALEGPVVLHGAHDHLRFSQALGAGLHLQSGAWSNAFQVLTVSRGPDSPHLAVRDVVLDEGAPEDAALARLVAGQTARWLWPADRAAIGRLAQPMDRDSLVARAAGWLCRQAGTDLGLLSHTTFGDGLPGGAVSAYDLAGFLRFDGGFSVGSIPPGRVDGLLARLDQLDGRTPYARRTGDFLHSSGTAGLPRDRPLRVAINAYPVSSAAGRIAMLGWDAPGFVPLPQLGTLSGLMARGLSAA